MKYSLNFIRHNITSGLNIKEFDSIRGWAILLVVLGHFFIEAGRPQYYIQIGTHFLRPTFVLGGAGADAGVALFFFISGFLLFLKYGRAYYEGKVLPSKLEFYKRRFFRLAPAYYVFLIITVIFIPASIKGFPDIVTHFFFIHTLFPEFQRSIINVFWTLGVEVQFYIIFPFIVSWFFGKKAKISMIVFIIWGIIFRILSYYLFPDCLDCPIKFVSNLPGRLDDFAIGMFFSNLWLYLSIKKEFSYSLKKSFGNWLIISGFVLSLTTIYLVNYSQRSSNIHNFFYIVIWHVPFDFFIGIMIIGLLLGGSIKILFVNPIMNFLGIISYSLYLCHKFFLDNINILEINHATGFKKFAYIIAIIGTISIVYSICSYFLIERPFLQIKLKENLNADVKFSKT